MNASKSEIIALMLEMVLIFVVAYFLRYEVLLPTTYFASIALLTMLLVIQILKNGRSKFLVFQIALLFLLIRSVYYLSTNYSIIPFGDGNWDYGVVKTFMQQGSISLIREPNPPANLLTWYSGWPLLHTLAVSLSQISGIDAFHIVLLLPSIISISSFVFIYLFIEEIRKSLKIDVRVTPLALLIYATSPDSVAWPMQFVRQNLGILLLTIILYLICLSTINSRNAKYKALTIFFAMSLVTTHHFTSFIMVSYLFLLFLFIAIGRYLAQTKLGNSLFWSSPSISTLGVALATFAFLFIWWDNFGTIIWPSVRSSITRFIHVLVGTKEIEYFPRLAYYPGSLTPTWALLLLRFRDVLMYIPAFSGLFLIAIKAKKIPHKFFVIYSSLAFGILFIIDNLFFRVEVYRLVTLALPFIALLTAISYTQLRRLKRIWNVLITATIVIVLLLSSFIGLWAHNFAPLHLYDPSINPMEVGERNTDFMRLSDISNEKVSTKNYEIIWADDINPLLLLLEPAEYKKVQRIPTENVQKLGSYSNEVVFVLKDLNLYFYYARIYTPVKTPENAEVLKYELERHFQSKFNRMYDDGKYKLWISSAML